MKKFNLTSVLFLAVILFTASCKKDGNPAGNSANTAKEFVALFGPQKQTLQVNASALPQTITLKGGTKILFPAGSLRIGGIAVTGNVTVEALEMLKRSDVLFSGTNTNHISGAPLQSDGFIFIDVKSNGVSVDKTLSVPINISIPANRPGFTQLWEGVENANNANQMAWQAPKPAGQGGGGVREANNVNGFYNFDFGTLGWINCDVFYSYTNPKTTITVTLVNNPGTLASFMAMTGETFVYFCAKGSNVAAQLYTPNGPNSVKSYDDSMPIGVEGKMISFCIKGGKFYIAEQVVTLTASQNITLTLAETTEAQIQAALTALNTY